MEIFKPLLLILALIIIIGLIVLLGVLLWMSPGKPGPFLDTEGNPLAGSLSEKVFIQVGGVRQGMFIRSKNTQNPVLLYLHGGPSFPNYFLIDKYQPGLEDYFTVCYWEQRGGGLSYSPDVSVESMNFDQLVADAIEVTNYLRQRFEKEKIYILAHSGGTPIALQTIAQNPQLFVAYMAMAQITDQATSEKMAYEYMMEQLKALNDQNAIKEMEKFPILGNDNLIYDFYTSPLRDRMMHELGIGTMREMRSIFKDVFLPVWRCRAYSLSEKINIWKSKFFFLPKTGLNRELLSRNFAEEVPQLEIPVYFFCGKYDFTVNAALSKNYFYKLEAPLKGFYTFENSAHSPLFEEKDRFRKIVEVNVLKGQISLSDL